MTASDWSRLRPILEGLLARSDEEHDAFLAQACGGDDDLARRALRLLAQDRRDEGFLARPAPRDEVDTSPGRGGLVGRWRLVEPLGAGGMGRVWLAERDDGTYRQRVALKLLRSDVASPALRARFDRERRALARLEHPGIARLLDGGSTDDGVPWLAMEHVAGRPLDVHADARQLPVVERLRLFLEVCDAVSAAHARLVIHRDLKPSNVLVDDDGRVRLLDFGVARLLDPAGDTDANGARETAPRPEPVDDDLTRTASRPFTPRYASPEQVRGDPVGVTTDVYSLGVVLHELLTGVRPAFPGEGGGGASGRDGSPGDPRPLSAQAPRAGTDARAAATRDPEPWLASAAATTGEDADARAQRRRERHAGRLARRLSGDLDAIVARALHAEPDDRYATVAALADDVRRHLEHRPVRARPQARAARAVKALRRHAVPAVAATAVFGALLVTALVSWRSSLASRRHAQAAELALAREEDARRRAASLFESLLERSLDTTFRYALDVQSLPGAAAVGVAMLDAAVADLEHLLADAEADDPALRAQLARAFTRLGDAQGHPAYPNVGEVDTAEDSYRRALAVAASLPAGEPSRADVLALCEARLGEILEVQGRGAEATAHLDRALALRELDVDARPDDRAARTALALAHDKLGTHLMRIGRGDEARPHHERYLADVAALHAEDPDDPLVAMHVGFAHQRLGAAAWARGDHEASRDASLAAARHFEHLLEGDRRHVTLRGQAGWSWYWTGNAEVQLERWDAAEAALGRARRLYEDLLAEDPDNAQHAQPLGGVYEMLGNVARSRTATEDDAASRRAGWEAARTWYLRALDLWRRRTEPQYAHLPEVMARKVAECDEVLAKE